MGILKKLLHSVDARVNPKIGTLPKKEAKARLAELRDKPSPPYLWRVFTVTSGGGDSPPWRINRAMLNAPNNATGVRPHGANLPTYCMHDRLEDVPHLAERVQAHLRGEPVDAAHPPEWTSWTTSLQSALVCFTTSCVDTDELYIAIADTSKLNCADVYWCRDLHACGQIAHTEYAHEYLIHGVVDSDAYGSIKLSDLIGQRVVKSAQKGREWLLPLLGRPHRGHLSLTLEDMRIAKASAIRFVRVQSTRGHGIHMYLRNDVAVYYFLTVLGGQFTGVERFTAEDFENMLEVLAEEPALSCPDEWRELQNTLLRLAELEMRADVRQIWAAMRTLLSFVRGLGIDLAG